MHVVVRVALQYVAARRCSLIEKRDVLKTWQAFLSSRRNNNVYHWNYWTNSFVVSWNGRWYCRDRTASYFLLRILRRFRIITVMLERGVGRHSQPRRLRKPSPTAAASAMPQPTPTTTDFLPFLCFSSLKAPWDLAVLTDGSITRLIFSKREKISSLLKAFVAKW